MGWFRKEVERDEQAPWAGPFGAPVASASAQFNPMVKTAGQLAGAVEPTPAQTHIAAA